MYVINIVDILMIYCKPMIYYFVFPRYSFDLYASFKKSNIYNNTQIWVTLAWWTMDQENLLGKR